MTPNTGFFVDWDGDTRRVEAPGDGYVCRVVQRDGYLGVDVDDPEGFVCHEATYYPSIEALQAAGVVVNLISDFTAAARQAAVGGADATASVAPRRR